MASSIALSRTINNVAIIAYTLLCFNKDSSTTLAFNNIVINSYSSTLAFVSPHRSSVVTSPSSKNFNYYGQQHETTSSTSLAAQRRGRPKGPLRTIEVKPPMNIEIEYDEIRVTTPNPKGKDDTLGIMTKAEALEKAKELGNLDLILINSNVDPPVCSIQDYSKYRYNKEKKSKEKKKQNKGNELKEVKMSYKIGTHDYDVRKSNADKFLNQGNRVKCTVQFKGREMQHEKLGTQLLYKICEDLTDICTMEGKPRKDGRNLSCILTPRPELTKKINEKKRKAMKDKTKKLDEKRKMLKEKKEEAAMASGLEIPDIDEEINGLDALLSSDDDDTSLDDLLDDGISGDLGDLFG